MPFPTSVDALVDAPPFVEAARIKSSQVLGPQRITVGPTMFNVKSDQYGAVGDGITDDRVAIQAALTAARTAGGGIVFFPPGTYLCSSAAATYDFGANACLIIGAKTQILSPGRDVTTIKMANSQTGANNFVFLNFNAVASGDEQITFQDISVDGNAVNQNPAGLNNGFTISRARGVRFLRVRSFNHWGTNVSTHEGSDINVNYSTDISFTDCECPNTAVATSAGFSVNNCTGAKFSGCVAFGSGSGHGFTHSFCRQIQYVNCHSYLNNQFGFNSENSDSVNYVNCISGGQAASNAAGVNPNYPYAQNLSLGNGQHGFSISNATQGAVGHVTECRSLNNGAAGLFHNSTASLRIIGGEFSGNTGFGIQFGGPLPTDTRITGAPTVVANTAGGLTNGTQTWLPRTALAAPPAVPATGVTQTNVFGFDAIVYVIGGTVSAIAVAGTTTGVTSGPIRVPGGATIAITYTVVPTWAWFMD